MNKGLKYSLVIIGPLFLAGTLFYAYQKLSKKPSYDQKKLDEYIAKFKALSATERIDAIKNNVALNKVTDATALISVYSQKPEAFPEADKERLYGYLNTIFANK